ncbi:hypothetical protein OIU85_015177 [Salix viminalis]|uniref:Uncharacterized protein n=1 Tax=Salix viminalis TaxID=40686 RepID=A0A9Q0NKC7_SALVM|nr:hypothetical protein OIU85_015177 [Salix viminalis]KAJ6671406.1 hypothetical protein OIU85_015177 [Salix viminalis]
MKVLPAERQRRKGDEKSQNLLESFVESQENELTNWAQSDARRLSTAGIFSLPVNIFETPFLKLVYILSHNSGIHGNAWVKLIFSKLLRPSYSTGQW